MVRAVTFCEGPLIDPDTGAAFLGCSEIEAGARSAFCMNEAAVRRIGECGVRDQNLAWGEGTRILLLLSGPRAKKGDLETQRTRRVVIEPSGYVPPLEAKIGVTAFVVREPHWVSRHDGRKNRAPCRQLGPRRRWLCEYARRQEGRSQCHHHLASSHPGHFGACSGSIAPGCHQSSRTARATSYFIAGLALQIAVSVASAMIDKASAASGTPGKCISMLQWNDWRLMTWTRIRLMIHPT